MLSDLDTVILSLIEEGFQYGYEINKIIEQRNMRYWADVAVSSIYYILKKLEEKNLITSQFEMAPGNPPRKIFKITHKGKEALHQKLISILSNYNKIIDPFEIGINGINRLTIEEIEEASQNYLISIDKAIEYNQDRLRNIIDMGFPFYIRGLATHTLAHLEAEKTWFKQFYKDIMNNEETRNFGMNRD